MRNFYATYGGSEKLQQLVAEIAWGQNIVIMERCKDPLEREFYLRMTRRTGWSRSVLVHQIANQTYEKTLLSQSNFAETLPESAQTEAKLALKDEYLFDFLELGEEHSERELERAILARVERFLRAMGGMFSFIGSQYRLEAGDREYFIDLLLFHRRLRCLVALELKVGEFEPEHVGKMQFYLALLDDTAREDGENPSIGIILCKDRDKTIVEYALRNAAKPIGVAEYRILPELPRELRGLLPEPADIARLMEDL
jgi:predicted nuclease of restriction endonuclease-like (RecB) superfamily